MSSTALTVLNDNEIIGLFNKIQKVERINNMVIKKTDENIELIKQLKLLLYKKTYDKLNLQIANH